MSNLRSLRNAKSQVVGAHQAREQQHGRQLYADQIRSEQNDADLFGCDHPRFQLRASATRQQVGDFTQQHTR